MGNNDENAPHADVVFMGAARVGKTTLVHRIMCVDSSLALEGRYAPTVEDSYIRQFLAGETSCRLRLVDTAGGYEFPAMERLWIKRASAFVLVCSRDDPSSLVHLRNLLNRIKNERQCDLKRLLLVLVMNKCDLHMKEWMIPDEDLELLADEYEIPYRSIVFTSALNQTGVAQIFKMLWEQNEESGTRVIKFEPRTSAAEINRRSSAFAVLFGNVQARVAQKMSPNNAGRPHTGSFGDNVLPATRRFQSTSSTSPSWVVKTFGRINLGGKTRMKQRYPPAAIDLNCAIS
ncbi:Ras- protein rapA [Clonorchis sinensis]|uniref:Ras- protein rapA n=1 Tax=Clonorchis sinensis TaxID=79923 RepID=A0A419Q9E5_CLOSI|nr:Ras- protein rapA [Clonorchis sinensis]